MGGWNNTSVMSKNSTDITCSNFSAVCPRCTFMPLAQQFNTDDFQKDTHSPHQYSKVVRSKAAILINLELEAYSFSSGEFPLSCQVFFNFHFWHWNVSQYLQKKKKKSCCNGLNPTARITCPWCGDHVVMHVILTALITSKTRVQGGFICFTFAKLVALCYIGEIQNENKVFCGVWNDELGGLKA